MCGIAGIIDAAGQTASREEVARMIEVMKPRGPDGLGFHFAGRVGMAMRRLSVIDPEQGWQPMIAGEGRVVVFQNGEIYNFRLVRKTLEAAGYSFRTNSDTEVLLHGFVEWGVDGLLDRIDGMFALAILDSEKGLLHLARDRFGEKPLYYSGRDGRFAYSSDMRSLAALPWVDNRLDTLALDRYLALHFSPGEATVLKNVKRLLPGETISMNLDARIVRRFRYYVPPIGAGKRSEPGEIEESLEYAVGSRMVSDVPVGVFLSGGLDSSLVASIAAKKVRGIATFSMGFESGKHDESSFAKTVARKIGSTHHHFVFDEGRFLTLLPEVASAFDEPVGDQAALPLYWLCREARKHVTVVLAGEGADEVFAGYSYYPTTGNPGSWLGRLLRPGKDTRNTAATALLDDRSRSTPSGFPILTSSFERQAMLCGRTFLPDEWESGLLDWLNKASDRLQQATCADIATWLPDDLLVKFDRMAMANSLEGRAPFLQHDLVEKGISLAPHERKNAKTSKAALRKAARNLLPEEILERPKQGFVLPMRDWIRAWFDDKGGAVRYFRNRAVPEMDMYSVTKTVEKDLATGILRERLDFALLMLTEWHYAFKRTVEDLRRWRPKPGQDLTSPLSPTDPCQSNR